MARNEQLVKFALAYPRVYGLITMLIGILLAGYFLVWPVMQMEQHAAHIEYSPPLGAVGALAVLLGLLILVFGQRVIGIALMEHHDRIDHYGKARVYVGYAILIVVSIAFYIYCDHYIAAHGYTETH